MGSSAALTSSLVGALLHWFGEVDITSDSDLKVVHNLSQLVHANAQGKIGSGFDVSAAIYGTSRYRRFSAEWLSPCMQHPVVPGVLREVVVNHPRRWDMVVDPFQLPPHVDLLLGDVCSGGTSSTSMAKVVLRWMQEGGDQAIHIVDQLAASNSCIFSALQQLTQLSQVPLLFFTNTTSFLPILQEDPYKYAEGLRIAMEQFPSDWQLFNNNVIIDHILICGQLPMSNFLPISN